MVVYFAFVWVEVLETIKANFRKWHSTWYLMFVKRAKASCQHLLSPHSWGWKGDQCWVWRRKPSILRGALLLPTMFGRGDVMTDQHQGVGGPTCIEQPLLY